MKHPEYVDMVIFRENTEDIYSGIEFANGTEDNKKFKKLFKEAFPQGICQDALPRDQRHRHQARVDAKGRSGWCAPRSSGR